MPMMPPIVFVASEHTGNTSLITSFVYPCFVEALSKKQKHAPVCPVQWNLYR